MSEGNPKRRKGRTSKLPLLELTMKVPLEYRCAPGAHAKAAALGEPDKCEWCGRKQATRRELLLRLIRAGRSREVACMTVGLSFDTLNEWIARGEGQGPHGGRPQTPGHVQLAQEIREAEGASCGVLEGIVMSAEQEPGQRAKSVAWMLERRLRRTYGMQPLRVEHDTTAHAVALLERAKRMTDEELLRELRDDARDDHDGD